MQALSEYLANPYDIQNNNLTVADLYQRWSSEYFQALGEPSTRTIIAAWKYCHKIYGMRVKDLRARHIKGIIEDGYVIRESGKDARKKIPASPGTKSRIKSLFNVMLDYALNMNLLTEITPVHLIYLTMS